MDGQGMYTAFCSDGDDMCRGPFKHTLSNAQVISDFINHITSKGVVEAMEYGNSTAYPLDNNARASDHLHHR